MKTEYTTIQELKTPIKISKMLFFYDIAFVGGYTYAASKLVFLVHPYLEIPYYILCVGWGIFFTLPSQMNRNKRMWQTLLFALVRDRCIYKPIKEEKEYEPK